MTGERIELPDGDSSKAPPASGLVWQPWMIGVIIAVVLAVAYAVLRVVKKNRKQEEADHE
ncbi:hypothetical protein [Arcanobacterium hippocoleae]|uniref:hypothetical protein n=1 Tax=Arcanobacterium hippocoleae TaxID=149017 RepID=UPI00334210C3